jgi:hypothetical protein
VKKVLLIVVVAALALTLVPLAIAGGHGGWKHGKSKFNLVGSVTAVDATATETAAGTVTIKVKAGTKTVRAFRGLDATMTVALNARVRLLTEDGAVAITLAEVPFPAKVKVRGTVDRTDPANPVFVIKDLKVKAPAEEPATPPADETPPPVQ